MFTEHCVHGLEADRQQIQSYLQRSLMLVTALSPVIGYDNCAKIAHEAMVKGLTLREAAVGSGLISAADFDKVVDPAKMV
jgi:fumarate hydratase class II